MSDHHEEPVDLNLLEEMGYEQRDINPGQLTKYLGLFFGISTLVMFVGLGFMAMVAKDFVGEKPKESFAPRLREPVAPAPKLQSNATALADQIEFVKSQRESISTYAWTDRKTRHVRIPIDEAMKKVLAQGLPARANPHAKEEAE